MLKPLPGHTAGQGRHVFRRYVSSTPNRRHTLRQPCPRRCRLRNESVDRICEPIRSGDGRPRPLHHGGRARRCRVTHLSPRRGRPCRGARGPGHGAGDPYGPRYHLWVGLDDQADHGDRRDDPGRAGQDRPRRPGGRLAPRASRPHGARRSERTARQRAYGPARDHPTRLVALHHGSRHTGMGGNRRRRAVRRGVHSGASGGSDGR